MIEGDCEEQPDDFFVRHPAPGDAAGHMTAAAA
jgi:hypothetical protein